MRKARNWDVSTWARTELNWRGERVEIPGAQIRDRDTGLTFYATIGTGRGGPWLTSLAIVPASEEQLLTTLLTAAGATPTSPVERIDRRVLDSIPVRELAEAVDGLLRVQSERGADIVIGRVDRTWGRMPDLRELAKNYPKHKRVDLAALYGVSPSTLDRWVAEARRQDLLPPATTGRPPRAQPMERKPNPKTPDDRRGRRRTKKEGTQ